MHIPDCRKGEGLYNEKYLTDKDKQFIQGFDKGVEAVLNMFCNLEVYQDELLDADFNVRKVDEMALTKQFDDCQTFDEKDYECLPEEEFDKLDDRTKLMCILMQSIADWAEGERNNIITSMIDNTDTVVLEENQKKYENADK